MRETKAAYFSLVVEPNDDGYLAECPGLQGAFAEGESIEEAIFNCVDVPYYRSFRICHIALVISKRTFVPSCLRTLLASESAS
jgi:hypothetical protein